MYLRFAGPKEAKITIYRGFDAGQTLELPCTIGFRPGYAYRVAISDVPAYPRQVFFPTIEVRGTLVLMAKLRNADYPAQINFSEDEFGRVLKGSFVKKVVVLERPDQALPIATRADAPVEIAVTGANDPLDAGNKRGQPLVVLQMGQRFFTPQELNGMAVPGTVLLPGSRVLGTPRQPPSLIWNWCPVYDTVLGPRDLSEYLKLYDGGDSGAPAGFGREGKLKGLDPTDTVAEYRDSRGNRRLVVSNRVSLCVPRFLIFKSESAAATQQGRSSLENALSTKAPANVDGQIAPQEQTQQAHAEGVDAKTRISGAMQTMGTSVVGRSLGVVVKSSLRAAETVDVIAARPMKSEPDGPLLIIKWPDKACVLIGDVVTFHLKYTNSGGQPITNVVVSDSLTARFQYVKGSAKTDRDATFTVQVNEVGSEVLRWEIDGKLEPRESGIISFQVRIR